MRLLLLILSASILLVGCSPSGEESPDPVFVPLSSPFSDPSSVPAQAEGEPLSRQAVLSGVSLTAEYPVYGADAPWISFLLENLSGSEITYGLDYSMEYNNQGKWEVVPRGNAAVNSIAFSVSDRGHRAVTAAPSAYEWDWREGEYRLTLPVFFDREQGTVWGRFSIGESDITAAGPYGAVPLESLPASYSEEQRERDGVVSQVHGAIQYNGDKIAEFLQKVEYGFPAMLRVSYATVEGDPIFTDIEYHPESQSFRRLYDNSRDRFGLYEGIAARWYPYLVIAEDDGKTELYLCERKDGGDANRIAVCAIPAENREDCLKIWNQLKEKYSGDNLLQKTFSPSGESWAGLADQKTVAVQLPGKGYAADLGDKEAHHLQWRDGEILEIWTSESGFWLYDTRSETFTGQIEVCGLPRSEGS